MALADIMNKDPELFDKICNSSNNGEIISAIFDSLTNFDEVLTDAVTNIPKLHKFSNKICEALENFYKDEKIPDCKTA